VCACIHTYIHMCIYCVHIIHINKGEGKIYPVLCHNGTEGEKIRVHSSTLS